MINRENVDAAEKDAFAFFNFNDLVEMRIVTNRVDLHEKQQRFGFPKPVKLGGRGRSGTALFPRDAVKAWIAKRRAEQDAPE